MSDKIREDFEKWSESEGYNFNEPHWAVKKELMLECWQASRASLVVNTSELHSADYYVTGSVYLSDVEDMLDKVGIRYE